MTLTTFNNLLDRAIGFDRMLSSTGNSNSNRFPYYNIVQNNESDHKGDYIIEVALAGYHKSDLDIEFKNNLLSISSNSVKDDDRDYIHKGIAKRSFDLEFVVGRHFEVTNASLKDGVLKIDIVNDIEKNPTKKIAIN